MIDLDIICKKIRASADRTDERLLQVDSHKWSIDVLDDLAAYFEKNGLSEVADEVNETRLKVRGMLDPAAAA